MCTVSMPRLPAVSRDTRHEEEQGASQPTVDLLTCGGTTRTDSTLSEPSAGLEKDGKRWDTLPQLASDNQRPSIARPGEATNALRLDPTLHRPAQACERQRSPRGADSQGALLLLDGSYIDQVIAPLPHSHAVSEGANMTVYNGLPSSACTGKGKRKSMSSVKVVGFLSSARCRLAQLFGDSK